LDSRIVWLISVLVDFLLAVLIIRRYRWTIAGGWYDPRARCKVEFETHYTVAVSGPIRDNRRKLGLRSAKYHQFMLFKKFHKFVPLRDIKVRYEREERVRRAGNEIPVKTRAMQYRGKEWEATSYPDTTIPQHPSKDERTVLKMLSDLEKIDRDSEAKLKHNRALKKRLWKELEKNAGK
jgi:hypothetical protein